MASGITLTKVRRLYVFSSLKYCTWSQHMYSCSMQFWNNSFQLMKTMVRMDRDPTSSPARHPNTCTHTHTHTHTHTPHTNVHTPAHIHTQNAHVHPPTHTKTPIRTHTYTPPTTKAYPHAHAARRQHEHTHTRTQLPVPKHAHTCLHQLCLRKYAQVRAQYMCRDIIPNMFMTVTLILMHFREGEGGGGGLKQGLWRDTSSILFKLFVFLRICLSI